MYVGGNGKNYALDVTDLLCGFIQELDNRNIYLTTASERFEFMMEMYVTQVLDNEVNDAFDLFRGSNKEDLPYNTEYYRIMQQYTIWPIYDLYKLTWDKFIEQSWADIQFQLKMARQWKEEVSRETNKLAQEEKHIMLDESHSYKLANEGPSFKKQF